MTPVTPVTDDWHTWLAANPPPSLQELAKRYGGAGLIPPEAWAEYDTDYAQWESRRRSRLLGSGTWKVLGEKKIDSKRKMPKRLLGKKF